MDFSTPEEIVAVGDALIKFIDRGYYQSGVRWLGSFVPSDGTQRSCLCRCKAGRD